MAHRHHLDLTDAQQQELQQHRDHASHAYVRERCAALLKIAQGQSPHQVAQVGLLKPRDPDTLYHWLRLYRDEGLPGLLAHQQGGARRKCP